LYSPAVAFVCSPRIRTELNTSLPISYTWRADRGIYCSKRSKPVNLRSILVVVFLLAVLPRAAMAQSSRTHAELAPPSVELVAATRPGTDELISSVLAVKPEIPLGPSDVLQGYENGMTAIAERISAELASISEAVRLGHITREQADYLTQERYQLAIMQYQVLSTLHDSLAHDMAQVATRSTHSPTDERSATTVVVEPRFEGQSQ
jgi:hypothetical protein